MHSGHYGSVVAVFAYTVCIKLNIQRFCSVHTKTFYFHVYTKLARPEASPQAWRWRRSACTSARPTTRRKSEWTISRVKGNEHGRSHVRQINAGIGRHVACSAGTFAVGLLCRNPQIRISILVGSLGSGVSDKRLVWLQKK